MVEALILETTFLIDLERERHRRRPGKAAAFLELHENARLYLTFTIAGELAAGASLSDKHLWEAFVAPFHVLPSRRDVCWHYGQTFRHLQKNGQLVGANDLWIAATALAYDMPVVTSNSEHFGRVPGLEVMAY